MIVLFALVFTMTLFMPTVYAGGGKGGGGTTTNAAPVIAQGTKISIATNEDVPYTVALNATDANNDPMTWDISRNPSKGSVELSDPYGIGASQATIIYKPSLNISGTDSFVARVKDSKGVADSITVSITIKAVNDPPVNTTAPSIKGMPEVGQTLTANNGTWTDPDNAAEVLTYTYQWQRADDINGTNRSDLSANNSYTLIDSDAGKYICIVVTAKDSAGASSSAYSAWTLVNLPAPEPVNNPPVNTALPTINGTASVGQTLAASIGTWTDDKDAPGSLQYSYQWQWKGDTNETNTDITGANSSSYIVTEADLGKLICIKITAADSAGLFDVAYSDPTAAVTAPVPPPATISYVALGDSIATGTLYSGAAITPYVSLFYDFLVQQNPNSQVTLQSFATNGDRTNELYDKLGLNSAVAGNVDLISAVEGADIITISIGGNNLMQAAKDPSKLGGYNFDNINDAVAQQGVADFNAQWRAIIEKIKELNADVKVIWMTMYNPYNESDTAKHDQVDSYLFRGDGTGINDIINGHSTELGYYVANVYQSFNDGYRNNMGAITYFYPSPFDLWGNLTRNPHPNKAGQDIITSLHKQIYNEFIKQ